MKVLLHLSLLSLLLVSVGSVAQAETTQQEINLLQNGGFENPYSSQFYDNIFIAAGWHPWWVEPDSTEAFPSYCDYNIKPPSCQAYGRPEYKAAYPYSERIRSGGNAQAYFTFYRTHLAGLYQQVTGIAPGQALRFTVYIETWSTPEEKGFTSSVQPGMGVQVGIDPNGGTDALSPGVVWSQAQNAFDVWTPMSVEATARSSTVTVFIRSWPQLALQHNDVYADDAILTPIGAIATPENGTFATASAPNVTAAPVATLFSSSTPLPNGEVWYTVQPGDTLGRIAYLHDTTVEAIKQLNNLTSNTIISNQKLLVAIVTPSPTATDLPQPTVTVTALATQPPLPTLQPHAIASTSPDYGQLCVVAYNDANRNAANDNESPVPDVRVTLSVGVTPLDGYVTTDSESTHCFPQLPAGTYTVSVAAPAGYTATTASEATVQLKPENLVTLAFGLTSVTESLTPTETAPESLSSLTVFLIGLGGLTLITGGLGVTAFLWLKRK
jgi:LysM repeat protein